MFTRKRTLLFLTLTVIGSVLIASCQPAAQPSDTEEPSTSPASENSITIVIAEDPPKPAAEVKEAPAPTADALTDALRGFDGQVAGIVRARKDGRVVLEVKKVVKVWESYGFTWGGRWSYTDPMHFEFRGTLRSAKRKTRRARRNLGGETTRLAYKVGDKVFGKLTRAATYLRGKLRRGKRGDDFHVRVVAKKGGKRGKR